MSVTPFGTAFSSTVHKRSTDAQIWNKRSTDAQIGTRVSLHALVFISVPSRDYFPLPKVTSHPQVLAERCISWDGHFVDIRIQVFDMSVKTKSVFPKYMQQHALSTAWTSLNFIVR